ncbi:MAG: hypothetical protein AAFX03_07965 [Pseudomonadota bacterium]
MRPDVLSGVWGWLSAHAGPVEFAVCALCLVNLTALFWIWRLHRALRRLRAALNAPSASAAQGEIDVSLLDRAADLQSAPHERDSDGGDGVAIFGMALIFAGIAAVLFRDRLTGLL